MNLRGYRDDELAPLVGVQPLTVWRWRDGRAMPHRETEAVLFAILGCTALEFFEGPIPDAPKLPRKPNKRHTRGTPQVDVTDDGTIIPRAPRATQAAS